MSESFSPSTQTNPRGAQGHFFCSTMHQNNDLCVMVKLVAFTHVWIALGAFGAAAATVLGHGHAVEEWSVFTWSGLTGIGVATGCVYTLQRRIKLRKNPSGIPRERRVFLERWENPMAWGWSVLAVAWAWACAPEWRSAVGLASDHPTVLFGVATLALGYASNPITGGRGWRDIPRLKWPVIALAWGLVTGWLPLQFLPSDVALGEWAAVESIGVQTLFVAGITLPFDVRDLTIDPAELRTVPQQSGVRFATALAITLVVLSMGGFWGLDTSSARAIAGAVALVGIVLVPSVRHEWIFSLWLDGCLILQGVLAFLLM